MQDFIARCIAVIGIILSFWIFGVTTLVISNVLNQTKQHKPLQQCRTLVTYSDGTLLTSCPTAHSRKIVTVMSN